MNLKEAREIGKLRKQAAIINEEKEALDLSDSLALSLRELEDEPKDLDKLADKLVETITLKAERDVTKVRKVEVVNQKETQKALIANFPEVFKVVGDVIAKVKFPAVQKVTGAVTAKIDNFPPVQEIKGRVKADVPFPKVQKVEVANFPKQETEVTNLPMGKADKEGDPERFLGVRFTDGKRYYDLKELVVAGGGMASAIKERIKNIAGDYINPATADKQDDILDELQKDEATQIAEDSGDSNITYIGKAPIGTATSAAGWKIKKLDATSGLVITWADGNSNYDNVWTNRESLSYS